MIRVAEHDVYALDGRLLLKQFSMTVACGEMVAVTGPNGCGKSTLLRQLAGVENCSPSAFRVTASRRSYIPTRPLELLLPWETVSKNIALFSSACRISSQEELVNAYANEMQIDTSHFLNQKAYALSSGQQALAAIFCALIQRPQLLIADEVFSFLAPGPKKRMAKWVRSQSLTLVCASHDEPFISELGARRICLEPFVT